MTTKITRRDLLQDAGLISLGLGITPSAAGPQQRSALITNLTRQREPVCAGPIQDPSKAHMPTLEMVCLIQNHNL